MKTVRVRVTGRVQGVCYRESTRLEAAGTGVNGWVRNLPDGSVEALLQGSSAVVEKMLEWMKKGPKFAMVDGLETEDVHTDELYTVFTVRY